MTEYISTQKYLRISPKKVREVVFIVKKLTPLEAVAKLPFVGRRAALTLLKVIKTAIANAKQKDVSPDALRFKEIQVGQGARLKRGRAGGRGRWKPYVRPTSHIRVVLTTTENSKTQNSKSKLSSNTKIQNNKNNEKS